MKSTGGKRAVESPIVWGLVFVSLGCLSIGQNAFGQNDDRSPSKCYFGTPDSGLRTTEGITSCGRCHESPKSTPSRIDSAYMSKWIRLDELAIWFDEDKHRQSYEVLLNERSQQMAKILGIVDPDTKKSLIHRDVRCLSCHSSVPIDHLKLDGTLVSTVVSKDPKFNYGVSCEGCHGPSGDGEDGAKGWESEHFDSEWSTVSPEDRFEQFGFWDVRSPRTQTKICLSCHMGNVEQGKIVTHEMYAAGHPPLPSFELATFVHQQPLHWRYAESKEGDFREKFFAMRGEEYDAQALYRTRSLLVSSLCSISEMAKLNADLIDSNVSCPTEKPTWPELANFSCFACHHDLERNGWRQFRPLTSTPGRPTLHEWPSAMADVAAEFLGKKDEFHQSLQNVYDVMNTQPFGDPESLVAASRELEVLTDALADRLQAQPIQIDNGKRLLTLIASKGADQEYDYDSARQLVWAYERVWSDIKKRSGDDTSVGEEEERRKWAGWFPDASKLDEREKLLASLGETLFLNLRLGEQVEQTFEGESSARKRVEIELGVTLERVGAYHPERVQQVFQKLLELSKG